MNNKKIDIILTSPPFSLKEDFGLLDFVGHYGPPINLLYLASSLEQSNIKTKLVDLSYETKSLEECARHIVSFNSEFVGIAVHFTFLVNKSLKLISLIKKLNPKVKIIVGGVHFTSLPLETMDECPEIDVGLLGEAEETLVETIKRLKDDISLSGINGIVFKNGKYLVKEGNSSLIADINKLPFPIFDKIDISSYSPALYKEKSNINLLITTSRGCPFKCTFCDRTVLGSKVRFYSIDYLSEMIDILVKRFKVRCFDVEDDNICITKERFKNICELFKDKFMKYKITWSCAMRADSVDSETGKILYDSGCRSVFFGLESGSTKMLNTYNKRLNIDIVVDKCKIIRDAGIILSGSFIIGGPGEDKESISETIKLIKKIGLDYMFLWYFAPFPGSVIYRDIESKGQLVGDYSNRSGQYISFIPNTLSREQLEEGYKKIYRTFYSKPSVIFRTLRKTKPSQIPQLVKNGIKYFQRFVLGK